MQALKSRHVWLKIVGVSLLLALIYLAYLAPLISPQEHLRNLPVAVVNEDAGAADQDFGAQVIESVTSRELRAVRWTTLPDRRAAVAGIERGDFYAAIIIPSDYSRILLTRAAPLTSPAAPSRTPEPATIEVLTNPAAGPVQASAAQAAAEEAVAGVSDATSEHLAARATAAQPPDPRALLTAQLLLEDPVRARITEVEPLGPDSARGLTPAYLAFLAALSSLMGAGAIHFGLLQNPAYHSGSRIVLWTARLLLAFPLALILSALETGIVRVLGVEHDAPALALFAMLAALIYASMAVVSLLVAHLGPTGPTGLALGAAFNVVLGQVASGGATPLEALPPSYAALAGWLPFSRATDAVRALLFYDGGTHEVMISALLSLGTYLAIAAFLGYAVALVGDLSHRRIGKAGRPHSDRKGEQNDA